jgi:hypothetical protein
LAVAVLRTDGSRPEARPGWGGFHPIAAVERFSGQESDGLTCRRSARRVTTPDASGSERKRIMAATQAANRYVGGPSPSGLADVVDLILDKGLVIDVYVRVSLVGIELLTIDARIVVASVDTYLRFAEAVGRLSLGEGDKEQISGLLGDGD